MEIHEQDAQIIRYFNKSNSFFKIKKSKRTTHTHNPDFIKKNKFEIFDFSRVVYSLNNS